MDPTYKPAISVLISAVVMKLLSSIVVLARLYVRLRILPKLGLDDYLMFGAYISSLGFMAVHFVAVIPGRLGMPIAAMSQSTRKTYLIALWLLGILYSLTLTLCKLSILIQYRAIFTAASSLTIERVCKGLMVTVVLAGTWGCLGSTFFCVPVEYYWGDAESGKCMDFAGLFFSVAALNIATDIAIFALPLPSIRSLRLPRKQKIGLTVVFALGFFVCIVSVLRLIGLYQISFAPAYDRSKHGISIAVWSSIEINIAMICGCLPMLKPLLVRIFPRLAWTNEDATLSIVRRTAYVTINEESGAAHIREGEGNGSSIGGKGSANVGVGVFVVGDDAAQNQHQLRDLSPVAEIMGEDIGVELGTPKDEESEPKRIAIMSEHRITGWGWDGILDWLSTEHFVNVFEGFIGDYEFHGLDRTLYPLWRGGI
ncbi:hypothetical protein MKZ38_004604 [Zalerion maritima]|uniref:Rhodopsin domain-containing protein n=1 Tax=Zalerion maritima TaxID=339359 RepID=A0AAD5RYF6_9PEZI|nr:hypothetical protein MKZ38_004604 [Zalerion maritima]